MKFLLCWVVMRYREARAVHNFQGSCRNCGYDLRATPDRYPECGAFPPKKEMISS
jgi:hypothetical protein